MAQLPFRNVDLVTAQCVDVGHHWTVTEYGRIRRDGLLRGAAARHLACVHCNSTRTDVLGNRGEVISRWYGFDDAYIDAARALGEFSERRANLRREAVRRNKNAAWFDE